jgi:Mrp family chromosome partitioning ATPase
MRQLLVQLCETHDLVIIDTPPALVVSDPIPLLEQVSGIVVIGRIGYTSKDSLARLTHVIANASGSLLGVIATGSRSSGLYGYGSTYGGYGPSPNGAADVQSAALQGTSQSSSQER